MVKVIVFGATGAVGSAAALEAHNRGAEVVLAMRDVNKAIPKLPSTLEKVQADLSDPASVKKVVEQTGAKAAFCYVAHGVEMKPVFEVMKAGGLDYVVLLSSWSVFPDAKAKATGDDYIAKIHAVAELALEEVGLKHTALRPCFFASNIYHQGDGLKKGQIFLYQPEKVLDYLSPEDIGSIAGAKLLSEPEMVPIAGPKLLTQRQAFEIVGKEWHKDMKIIELSREDYLKNAPMPEFITTSLAASLEEPESQTFPQDLYKQGAGAMKKYTGREPTSFEAFVRSQGSS